MIIFYDPKFIKLKPAIKKTTNQTKPFIKKKVNPPTRIYLPHLLFDKKFLSLVII